MKNIFYCSNAHKDIFNNNTRSKFECYIDINDLDYIPNHYIEAAIKSITYDNKREKKSLKDQVLAIRSNICESSIRNGEYDRLISLIHTSKLENDVVHVDFKNPVFFETRKELLSRCNFEIIDLDTNSAPNFSEGSPTYIQVVIRNRVQRMKKPFNIFLESSCEKSKLLYPKNDNTEFTIDLPQRMNFRKDWHVALKSLFIPNKFTNGVGVYVKYYHYNWKKFHLANGILKHLPFHSNTIEDCLKKFNMLLYIYQIKIKALLEEGKVTLKYEDEYIKVSVNNCSCTYSILNEENRIIQTRLLKVRNGEYKSLNALLREINEGFIKKEIPLIIKQMENGKVNIISKESMKNNHKYQLSLNRNLAFILGYRSNKRANQYLRFDQNLEYIAPHKSSKEEWYHNHTLTLSPNIAQILGFQKYTESKEEHTLDFKEVSKHTASFEPNIFLLHPRNIIVCCDIVENTIFGGEHVKLLKMVTNNLHSSTDILEFEFLQDEYVDLNVREFRSIQIAIMDATGNPIKTKSSIPTRLQLMFSTV